VHVLLNDLNVPAAHAVHVLVEPPGEMSPTAQSTHVGVDELHTELRHVELLSPTILWPAMQLKVMVDEWPVAPEPVRMTPSVGAVSELAQAMGRHDEYSGVDHAALAWHVLVNGRWPVEE
jgi:hypothetical protein